MDAIASYWSAIPWSWVGLSALCAVLAGVAVWLGRIESAIWFGVAALCTGYVGALHGQRDLARAELEQARAAVVRVEGERDNWREVAAQAGAKTLAWEAAARVAKKRATDAEKAAAGRAQALQDEIAALEASLAARGLIPLPQAIVDSRKATDALP